LPRHFWKCLISAIPCDIYKLIKNEADIIYRYFDLLVSGWHPQQSVIKNTILYFTKHRGRPQQLQLLLKWPLDYKYWPEEFDV
jgi:hypothetical protein